MKTVIVSTGGTEIFGVHPLVGRIVRFLVAPPNGKIIAVTTDEGCPLVNDGDVVVYFRDACENCEEGYRMVTEMTMDGNWVVLIKTRDNKPPTQAYWDVIRRGTYARLSTLSHCHCIWYSLFPGNRSWEQNRIVLNLSTSIAYSYQHNVATDLRPYVDRLIRIAPAGAPVCQQEH